MAELFIWVVLIGIIGLIIPSQKWCAVFVLVSFGLLCFIAYATGRMDDLFTLPGLIWHIFFIISGIIVLLKPLFD